MTTQRIIYETESVGVAVLIPAMNNAINDQTGQWIPLKTIDDPLPEGFRLCTVADIADKDVPEGAAFEIVEAATLPDRTSRNAWEWV